MQSIHGSLFLLLAAAALAGNVLADDGRVSADYRLVTDPAELALWGFDPHGPPLYRLQDQPAPAAAELAQWHETLDQRGQPASTGWRTVSPSDFQFEHDQVQYSLYQPFQSLTCSSHATTARAVAPIHLANDRRPRFLDVWVHDSAATVLHAGLIAACTSPQSPNQLTYTILGDVNSGDISGNATLSRMMPQGAHHVDNQHCQYFIRALFSSCSGGPQLQLRKARVIWD
ncbi:MAG: hypothetical protein M0Q42_01680 [Xanthomonadales bacterium]|nr:hypothetical protein [Xanthomonadales bacterium]